MSPLLLEIAWQSQSIAAIALCLLLLAVIHRHLVRPPLPLPPGPPGNNIFSNSLPRTFAYRTFEEWTKHYGPVFSLCQGLTTIIVIGRVQAAFDIMEKEAAATVNRPYSISAGDTLSGGMRVMLTPVGERFRKMRRQHIFDIIEKHQDHAKRYSASGVMSIGYQDPDIQAVNRCLTHTPAGTLFFGEDSEHRSHGLQLQDDHAEELDLFKRHPKEVQLKMARGEQIPDSFGKSPLFHMESMWNRFIPSPIDELAFTESANTHPMPFKVTFEPRVTRTLESMRELMEDYGV